MWYDSLEGVQFTKDNGKDLAKWVGGELQEISQGSPVITIMTTRGELLLRQGDWVTKDREGRFRIVRINKVDLKKELGLNKPKPRPTRPNKLHTVQ